MSVDVAAPAAVAAPAVNRGTSAGPRLTPITVAADHEVEPLLRSARAQVAALGLQVRNAARAAEAVETEVVALEAANADGEARARFDMEVAAYRRELDDAFAARRRELDADLAREAVEAEASIEAARVEAAAIVGPATDQLQRLLERISGPASDADLTSPSPSIPVAPIETDASPEPVVLPTPAAAVVASVEADAVAPVLPTAPAAPYLAYVLPPQDPNAPPTLYPAPAYMGQPMLMPGQPMMMPGQQMMMPGMMPAGMTMAPTGVATEPVERESFLRRLWHLDVMAPIIAVLIVLAILAAWVL